jgi:hypothetical protein
MGRTVGERHRLARALRLLADLIESSSPEFVDELLEGRGRLTVGPREAAPKRLPAKARSQDRRWAEVAAKLRSLSSREEGEKLLDDLATTKADMERLARAMGLPVSKDDSAERLRTKLIESSIGARLGSQATRGTEIVPEETSYLAWLDGVLSSLRRSPSSLAKLTTSEEHRWASRAVSENVLQWGPVSGCVRLPP